MRSFRLILSFLISVLIPLSFPMPASSAGGSDFPEIGKYQGGALRLQRLTAVNRLCSAVAPQNWSIDSVSGTGNAVDLSAPDKGAYAGHMIVGVPGGYRQVSPQHRSPEIFIHHTMSQGGSQLIQYGSPKQDAMGYIVQPYQKAAASGVLIYKVFPVPGDPGGYIVSVRLAEVKKSLWQGYSAVALAVAMSIRCTVTASTPSGGSAKDRRKVSEDAKHESSYNVQLGMEYAHDSKTGENYWVSPSTDLRQGPNGLGYYKQVGNQVIKLETGMAP